jgi:short-subunit dehydrogenase
MEGNPRRDPRSILITGASSGIGATLAREYASPGRALALTGRDADRLEAIANACRDRGAEVDTALIDVRDRPALGGWIATIDEARPLDLVIANAGISAGTGGGGEDGAQFQRIFETNVQGVANTVEPAVTHMTARGRGQIALMASLAGFRGFPGAPAYCASKAAVRIWGEALRDGPRGQGIAVSVICPGFVESPMTEVNDFPMPLKMSAERAVRIIRRGLVADKARIAFPLRLYLVARIIAALPPDLVAPLLRRMPEKT